ncbi:NAD(P) transhydrogenase subunit alpha [Anaerolineales bacterium HSG24]|nr:NAD(P) transhydrogenase subunit alpha [Anaerolineales bacterium HSG24]
MRHLKQITYTIFVTLLIFMALTTPVLAAQEANSSGESLTPIYLAFILALSIFLGFELISKVPATLHTPLMSGSNAISGITLVGALLAAGYDSEMSATILGTLAVTFATINVVGGYMVTDRMLEMFKKKGD